MLSAASVCLFVCQHDNLRTIKHRTTKLGGWVQSTEISPEFECQGQRSEIRVTEDKRKRKMRHFVRESSCGARSSCGIFSGVVFGGAVFYAGGKISACCRVGNYYRFTAIIHKTTCVIRYTAVEKWGILLEQSFTARVPNTKAVNQTCDRCGSMR